MSKSKVPDNAKSYELMVIINPEIGENAIQERLNVLKKQINGFPGEIFHEEVWGLKNLAYPIKKHEQGFYVVLDFLAAPHVLKEFNAGLLLDNEVLRHLITTLPSNYEPRDYAALAEEEKLKEEAAKNEEKVGSTEKKPRRTEKVMFSKEENVKKDTSEKESSKDEEPKKVSKKNTSKKGAEEVDKKLENILENPDLNF